jgi:endo-1,4-beta-D-glucanase Y
MKAALLALVFLQIAAVPQARSQSTWPFWDHYAAHFLSPSGRVIDPDQNGMTTSEGQSYAMFFALVANDRSSFDRLFSWTENNLADGDLAENLPAWSWGRTSGGGWGVLDKNSAADSDLWIAYSLIEAGTLWGKAGYRQTGEALLALIAQEEVAQLPNLGPVLLPGKDGFHPAPDQWLLNPSYLPLPLLFAASQFELKGPWRQMALELPNLMQRASPSGFAMDWVQCGLEGLVASSEPGKPSKNARGSYDAIRVYLWAGMTAKETPGAEKILQIFAPMSHYVRTHSGPPEIVGSDGRILSASAPVGFSAALVPFLWSSGDKTSAAALKKMATAEFSESTGLLGSPARYYDQNLALFALGWQEQRFQFAPDGTLRVRWNN